jgi:ABC-type glutathione transport system ATPase component
LAAERCGLLLATHSLDVVEHHADAAALLLDGEIALTWTAAEIERLSASGASGREGLEAALAAASDLAARG